MIVLVWVPYCLGYGLILYFLVWFLWNGRGKDMLFVNSDSPIWQDYIRQNVLPKIEHRAIILNWSERQRWLATWSLPALVFKHFIGAHREFNPSAIVFRPFRLHRTFRFWKPFQDWKHGNPATLQKIENEFYFYLGLKAEDAPK
jgi:hypothetical protein